MNMKRLLEELKVEAPPGATEADLVAFERQTGLKLPERVRALYALCDGVVLSEKRLEILPLAGVRELVAGMRDRGIPQRWGYFPFTDNADSDPFCVCCNAPLTGYIVQVSHDDSAAIKFRSLDSFLAALQECVRTDKWDLSEMPSEFRGADRTGQDIRAGRELLETAPELEEVEQGDAFRFGMWLLSEQQVGEVAALLEHEDSYVREDAAARLAAMQSVEARQALRAAEDSLKQFVRQGAEALARAGIKATVIDGTQLRLDPGPVWLNVGSFYSRRNDPDVYEFLVERSLFFLSRRGGKS